MVLAVSGRIQTTGGNLRSLKRVHRERSVASVHFQLISTGATILAARGAMNSHSSPT